MRDALRPWLAAALALLFAGLGHAYLRRWGRALVWFLTIVIGGVLLFSMYGVEPVDPISDPAGYTESIPTDMMLPIVLLFVLSSLDAFLVAREQITQRAREEAAAAAAQARSGGPEGAAGGAGNGGNGGDSGLASAVPDDLTTELDERGVRTVDCPHCGKATDADIDFCHWCTEPLPWADDDGDEAQKA